MLFVGSFINRGGVVVECFLCIFCLFTFIMMGVNVFPPEQSYIESKLIDSVYFVRG